MKATIDGVTYEGTVDEIRDIMENPPRRRGEGQIRLAPPLFEPWLWPDPNRGQRNWDGSPRVTC